MVSLLINGVFTPNPPLNHVEKHMTSGGRRILKQGKGEQL
jgi:hypothetical protein